MLRRRRPGRSEPREEVDGGPEQQRALEARPACRSEDRSEEHTSELQSPCNLVCRLLLEKKHYWSPLKVASAIRFSAASRANTPAGLAIPARLTRFLAAIPSLPSRGMSVISVCDCPRTS